ncbi:MAG: NmrA family NAD(P)-binding protein [Woeseiaceae bacterium]|nr:NmrA family NAD(P)-binding protein [Woeseiaceae bacterium]
MRVTKKILAWLGGLLVVGYIAIAIRVATYDNTAPSYDGPRATYATIAIFGASGTAGDGILKAALASPDVETIHVITRRETPRIAEGVAAGKVEMTIHMDYLDYAAIHKQITDVDAVFWAIGLSSLGVEEDLYRRIHVDFPRRFVEEWAEVATKPAISFHYISSSDISEDARSMWARVKVEAENSLFDFAEGSKMRVIAYRPDYIGPTEEEAHPGQTILYGFFKPLGAALKAEQIGQAMMEATSRQAEFANGDKLGTFKIIRYSDAFEVR